MTLQSGGQAPYTTAAAAITVIDAFRDRGLGTPITPEVLIRAGVPETLGNRTLQSLKLLGLVGSDGMPSDQFEDFRRIRGDEEYKARLVEWLHGVYADVLQYADPSKDSYDRVTEAFRTYEPAGQRRGMASLLLGLWRYAGLSVASAPAGNGSGNQARVRKVKPEIQKAVARRQRRDVDMIQAPAPQAPLRPNMEGLPPGLLGLLQQIPQNGKGWTSERRDAFLAAFTAVLNFTVPILAEEATVIASANDSDWIDFDAEEIDPE